MATYYNEIDPKKAAWLRELINRNLIAPGDVDERSITDVQPEDLTGYTQCHFFAGLGAWSYALRLAGWPDNRPVWSGSCPCPSFSAAGKGEGFSDPRHLWPDWSRLIRECSPPVVLGEQVASAIGYGWLDLIQNDLEKQDYAVGKAVLGACSVGAPHIRQRLWWVADTTDARRNHARQHDGGRSLLPARSEQCCTDGGLADANGGNPNAKREQRSGEQRQFEEDGGVGQLDNTVSDGRGTRGNNHGSNDGLFANAAGCTCRPGPTNGYWRNPDWLLCRDGKWRPVRSGTFPLAHGAPARVVRLRGYGDAICVPLAAEFIRAYLEARTKTVR